MSKFLLKTLICYRKLFGLNILLSAIILGIILLCFQFGGMVKSGLKGELNQRLGSIKNSWYGGSKFFSTNTMATFFKQNQTCGGSIHISGTLKNENRVGGVQIYGVENKFFNYFEEENKNFKFSADDGIAVSKDILSKWHLKIGDEIFLRFQKITEGSREIRLTFNKDLFVSKSVKIIGIVGDEQGGGFDFGAGHKNKYNVFVKKSLLEKWLEVENVANLVVTKIEQTDQLNRDFLQALDLENMGFVSKGHLYHYQGYFLPTKLMKSLQELDGLSPYLSYFVNEIKTSDQSSVYYSMVSFLNRQQMLDLQLNVSGQKALMADWFLENETISTGQQIALKYFTFGKKNTLVEKTISVNVAGFYSLDQGKINKSFSFDLKGISEQDDCQDWETDLPIDLKKISEKEENYWDRYQATPKLILSLELSGAFANDFGQYSGFTYLGDKNILKEKIGQELGFHFNSVYEVGKRGVSESYSFDWLLVTLNISLILSLLYFFIINYSLLLRLRAGEFEQLKVLGFSVVMVKKIIYREYLVVLLASLPLGFYFFYIGSPLLFILGKYLWAEENKINFISIEFDKLLLIVLSYLILMNGLFFIIKKKMKEVRVSFDLKNCMVAGIVVLAVSFFATLFIDEPSLLLIIVMIMGGSWVLVFWQAFKYLLMKPLSMGYLRLGLTIWFRYSSKNQLIAIFLVCGLILLCAMSVHFHQLGIDLSKHQSPSGGYQYQVNFSNAIFEDLTNKNARESLGLSSPSWENLKIKMAKVYHADDSSCRNINKPTNPSILGVELSQWVKEKRFHWHQLPAEQLKKGVHVDQNSLQWIYQKSVGEDIVIDENLSYHVAGKMPFTILQNYFVLDMQLFENTFSNIDGYQMILLDGDEKDLKMVLDEMNEVLEDYGLDVVPTNELYQSFIDVENRYIQVFLLLSGVGFLLAMICIAVHYYRDFLEQRKNYLSLWRSGVSIKEITITLFFTNYLFVNFSLLIGIFSSLYYMTKLYKQFSIQIYSSLLIIILYWVISLVICAVLAFICRSQMIRTMGNLREY